MLKMEFVRRFAPNCAAYVFAITLAACCGCQSHVRRAGLEAIEPNDIVPSTNMPRELQKVVMPQYVIEPPDVVTIDAVRVVPKPPYRVKSLDVLTIVATGTLPESPINGPFTVEPGGVIQLGLPYGAVSVGDMTLEQVTAVIEKRLRKYVQEPEASVTLAELASKQQIAGQHLVSPDGTVTLGTYGSVRIVGLTLAQAKEKIEEHLSATLEDPEIAVDVYSFNSKNYYIITQGAGLGDNVVRVPIVGGETVLDAIAQVRGLDSVSSKRIWIARPTGRPGDCQVLPIDWCSITEQASTGTNYQLMPGDRLFIAEDSLVSLDNKLAKLMAPAERLFSFTLLGTSTVSRIKFFKAQGVRGGAQ